MSVFGKKLGRRLERKEKLTRREMLKVFLPTAALTIIGFIIAFQFVDPAPPRTISIACGASDGANCIFAEDYREFMAKEGITLNIKTSAGALENLELLQRENDGVDVAFVQGGLGTLVHDKKIMSLGSLFFEPLWIFHRNGLLIDRTTDMKGMTLAVGEEGSGTRILTMHLLKLNGINAENSSIVSVGYQRAADMLAAGEVDVAFFVSTHHAPYVIQLIDSRSVNLIGMPRAEGYTFVYPHLYLLKVPEGVIDFEANIPARNLSLVASTTELVATTDLHPALVNLLMQASAEVHKSGTEFERQEEFPSPLYLGFKLSEDAEQYFDNGPPFLQRYLPFWVANFISRMKVMLLPLIVIFFPLFKIIPPLYAWRTRRKIYRWYSELDAVDPDLNREEAAESLQEFLVKLDEIEEKVCNVTVPPSYSEGLYALRLHIGMLREKLRHGVENDSPP
ncbi:MAG: TAXI family TRAP transporter solute-binding subunit [Halioglobus sp.]